MYIVVDLAMFSFYGYQLYQFYLQKNTTIVHEINFFTIYSPLQLYFIISITLKIIERLLQVLFEVPSQLSQIQP